MSLSRRQLLFGRLFGAEPSVEAQAPQIQLDDLLARARRRAPWEQPSSTRPPVAGHKARILVFDCLAHQGSPCSSCAEHCPEPDAIVLDARQRPSVNLGACTGCGRCAEACPAPRTAIAIGPEAR